MAALSVKSAELLLLSATLLRFRLLTSVLPDGAVAAWVSKVFEVPYPSRSATSAGSMTEPVGQAGQGRGLLGQHNRAAGRRTG